MKASKLTDRKMGCQEKGSPQRRRNVLAAEASAAAAAAQKNKDPDDIASVSGIAPAVAASKASEVISATAAEQKNQKDNVAPAVAS